MRIFTILLVLLLSGCGEKFDVKYLACTIDGKKCITIAKFESLETCERVRYLDSAYCDTKSDKNKITCDVRDSKISTSFCTKQYEFSQLVTDTKKLISWGYLT